VKASKQYRQRNQAPRTRGRPSRARRREQQRDTNPPLGPQAGIGISPGSSGERTNHGGGPAAVLGVQPAGFQPLRRATEGGPAPARVTMLGRRECRGRGAVGVRAGRPTEARVRGQGGPCACPHLAARLHPGATRHRQPLHLGHPHRRRRLRVQHWCAPFQVPTLSVFSLSLSLSLSGLNVARFSMVLFLSSSWLLDLGAQAPFCCMP
jgi:hypothetical protein